MAALSLIERSEAISLASGPSLVLICTHFFQEGIHEPAVFLPQTGRISSHLSIGTQPSV